jgi:hypothetical protein
LASGLIPLSDEQAKAIQEVAKATGTALSLVEKAGAYVGWVLGTLPADLVGVLGGDLLAQVRIRNLAKYAQRTEEILRDRGVTVPEPISPSLAIPLLRAAADESREELQELWARLLAASMDITMRDGVRHSFIEAVKVMDLMDVRVLHYIKSENTQSIRLGGNGDQSNMGIATLATSITARTDDVEVSVRHLHELDFLIAPDLGSRNTWFPSAKLREFTRICYPEQ